MTKLEGSETFSYKTGSDTGILVIHGFTSTTASVLNLAKFYADTGFNVECPILSGHGTKWENLENIKYHDFFSDVERSLEELKKRAKQIFITGLSMGGGLSLYLAENHPEIKGIIPINNTLIFTDIRFLFLPLLKNIIRTSAAVGSDIKDSTKKEICYDKVPSKAVFELLKLNKFIKKDLKKINQPILIFKSRNDHLIPGICATHTFDNVSSSDKELFWLENSYHVATLDFEFELICNKSLEFIKTHSS
jgi:carboxylesterase